MICPNCKQRAVEEPARPGDWCDQCLEEDRQAAEASEENRQMRRLDEALRKRPS